MIQLLVHLDPPSRAKFLHRPDGRKATNPTDNAQACEYPTIANSVDQRLRNNTAYAAEDISNEIIDRDTATGAFGHEPKDLS